MPGDLSETKIGSRRPACESPHASVGTLAIELLQAAYRLTKTPVTSATVTRAAVMSGAVTAERARSHARDRRVVIFRFARRSF
jgi:hypothetical protein